MKVGIFDSGVGGLTVLKCLLENKPNNEYIYVGDTVNMPFGEKRVDELKSISDKIIKYFLKREVDLIIIACGTISSTIYADIKDKYGVPIYDIISPTIEYLNNSNYNNIGIIGTVNTVKSNAFKNVNKSNVFVKSMPMLASMIEKGQDTSNYIKSELKYFDNKNIDILVLGCTHYPLRTYPYNTLNMAIPLIERVSEGEKRGLEINFTKLDDASKKLIINIIGNVKINEINL